LVFEGLVDHCIYHDGLAVAVEFVMQAEDK